jgi:hypothetical protein
MPRMGMPPFFIFGGIPYRRSGPPDFEFLTPARGRDILILYGEGLIPNLGTAISSRSEKGNS